MRALTHAIGRLARALRQRRAGWSPASDQAFHDQVFERHDIDPFDRAYPGNITIRRFADLAAERMQGVNRALDLGCGPGEITCELAARFPSVQFVGWDHSQAAIDRASAHAAARHLANVRFERVNACEARVPDDTDIALLFDAFHHLPEPAGCLARNAHVPRWFLIEPAGDILGRWRYRHDLDWLLADLDKVRWRLEHALGLPGPVPGEASPHADACGAIEFRYGLSEYEHLFAGYGVSVRGTTAGLLTYPPGAASRSELRRRVNDIAYGLYVEADERLREQETDLDCRHWAIYCERGATFPRRRPRSPSPDVQDTPPSPAGPYGIEYGPVTAPATIAAGAVFNVRLRVTNTGFLSWPTGSGEFHLSYRWLTDSGARAVGDGRRTPFARAVAPADTIETNLVVEAPASPGRYKLEIDGVHEGVTWFSEAGQPTLVVEIYVR
jgi:SAM-dependent methyltransferase